MIRKYCPQFINEINYVSPTFNQLWARLTLSPNDLDEYYRLANILETPTI